MGGNPSALQFCAFLFGAEPDGDSSFYQQFGPVPAGATAKLLALGLHQSHLTPTGRTLTSPILTATSSKPSSINASNAECWIHETVDLSPWVGQTIRVKFLVHQDGFGDLTGMFVDDVAVVVPGPCAPTPTPMPRATATPRPRPTPHPRP